jgi:hypothetical protein
MFKNAFGKNLTILHPNGNVEFVSTLVTHEELQKIEDNTNDIICNSTFIVDGKLDINVYDKIGYKDKIFEIKSISLIENIDGSKIFYKIKTI